MATPFSSETPKEPGMSRSVLLVASGAVILLVVIVAFATLRRAPADAGGPDAYAANLSIGNLQLSEATQGTGGKVTYIDGTVKNNGGKTVTGATVQLLFPSDDGTSQNPVTLALTLIRTRVPYVDTEAVSAEPLRPGESHDFRLIVETTPPNWNGQPPQVRVVRTTTE